mgnify:CR=1 FL=1
MKDIELICGDCLEIMPQICDESIDMILCDLPYQRTKNSWDTAIPFEPLWREYKRIIKPNGCIALFADGMFMADLMESNRAMWKYNLVWDKVLPSGFLNANRQPLRRHEELCFFYKKQPVYNPQKTAGKKSHSKGKEKNCANNNYGEFSFVDNSEKHGEMKFPTSILRFSKPHPSKSVHPTEKPVYLLEYIVRSYTNENDVVLDNCMGGGGVGVACVNAGRKFIGIELDKNYFDIAARRITEAQKGVAP